MLSYCEFLISEINRLSLALKKFLTQVIDKKKIFFLRLFQIFSEATLGLGPYQKYGSAFIAMGVSGGAWVSFPSENLTVAPKLTISISLLKIVPNSTSNTSRC